MEELTNIKKQIESLNLIRQKEILKILLKNNVDISENKNGSFINLTMVNNDVINQLKAYIKYIEDQEETISEIETMKQEFEESYFNKDNKDNKDNNDNGIEYVQTL